MQDSYQAVRFYPWLCRDSGIRVRGGHTVRQQPRGCHCAGAAYWGGHWRFTHGSPGVLLTGSEEVQKNCIPYQNQSTEQALHMLVFYRRTR